MKILSAAQMREVDRLTTERYGVPAIVLMENAAMRTVEAVEKKFGAMQGKRALILCGKGNNGGDGAAIARQLLAKSAQVSVILLGRVEDTKGEARVNFDILRALAQQVEGCNFFEIDNNEAFAQHTKAIACDLYFDALLGTGLARPAAGLFATAIQFLNQCKPVIAVDLPSGLRSDAAELIGASVKAALTVTFTAPKIANVFAPAADFNGEVIVTPIGSPATLINDAGSYINFVEPSMIAAWLTASRRTTQAHKGDAGKVLCIAGSRGKTGAAALTGEAAMRAGAGLVTIATAQSAQPAIAAQVLAECMTEALGETEAGAVSVEALEHALAFANERDVVAIGPGLSSADEPTRTFVRDMIRRRSRPMVIDADGLNALVGWTENLQGSAALPLILTPHTGEMARLVNQSITEVAQHRREIARDFAIAHQVILVLKGHRTLIAAPDGEVYVNPTGNAGMATGGSGDVLTGIVAGLYAQKTDDALGATIAAVYLHGLAGDLAAARCGTRALLASEISRHLGAAFIAIGGEAEKP
ncbi:MAG: NAD(P)H-hydrate dehydratase [Acidobacteria bacterium]|nr:NAD(P)H-hydrate dehydratase [Acidobacteriota bacterium]